MRLSRDASDPTPGDDAHALIPWRLLSERTPVPTALIDSECTMLHVSDSFATMTGAAADALVGQRLIDLVHPNDRSGFVRAISSDSGAPVTARAHRMCFADLTWHHVRWNMQPLGDASTSWCLLTAHDETLDLSGQADLLHRTELQLLLDRVTGTFSTSESSGTDLAITNALEAIGRHLGADRAYVLAYDFEERAESMTHEWAAPGSAPELATYQGVSFDTVPSGIIRSLRGEVVAVQSWAEAGPEWDLDRQFLEAEGIKSTIELPVSRHGQVVGSVGFDWTSGHGSWAPQDVEVLRLFATGISQLLTHRDHRAQLERQLQESQSRFAALVDNIPDPVMRVGLHGEVLYANAAARRKLLLDEEGRLRESESIWSQLADAQSDALESLEPQTVTYVLPGTVPRHLQTRVVPELDEFGQARSLLLLSTEVPTPHPIL